MTKDKKLRPSATEALLLIPDKTKEKFDISNYPCPKKKEKNIKKRKNIKNNNKETNNKILNNDNKFNNNNNNNDFKRNNELISGQTFYKFFRKNADKTERKKTQINPMGSKIGNITSSQNILFDSKNMNSYLIMSKTMGGTKESFFKQNISVFSFKFTTNSIFSISFFGAINGSSRK